MSITDTTRFETASKNAAAGFIGGLSQRFARYRTYRRTVDELEALTDRELSDLGIHRSMVRGIAYRAAYDG
jgi:uncharacterized protein YjiS (DUF1127 family)